MLSTLPISFSLLSLPSGGRGANLFGGSLLPRLMRSQISAHLQHTSSSPWQICTPAVRPLSYSGASHSTSCLLVLTHFGRACSTQEGCLPFSLHSSPFCPPEAVFELSVSRLEDCAADSALFANTEIFVWVGWERTQYWPQVWATSSNLDFPEPWIYSLLLCLKWWYFGLPFC